METYLRWDYIGNIPTHGVLRCQLHYKSKKRHSLLKTEFASIGYIYRYTRDPSPLTSIQKTLRNGRKAMFRYEGGRHPMWSEGGGVRGPSLAEIGFASFIGPSPAKEHHCRSLGRKKRERESEPRAGHQVVKVQPQPFPHKVTFWAPPSAAPVTRHPTPMIVGNSHPSNRPSIPRSVPFRPPLTRRAFIRSFSSR